MMSEHGRNYDDWFNAVAFVAQYDSDDYGRRIRTLITLCQTPNDQRGNPEWVDSVIVHPNNLGPEGLRAFRTTKPYRRRKPRVTSHQLALLMLLDQEGGAVDEPWLLEHLKSLGWARPFTTITTLAKRELIYPRPGRMWHIAPEGRRAL